MADKITIKVEGLEKAIKKIKKYQIIKREAVSIALISVGLKIESAAKQIITEKRAVDTGRLRASISVNWSSSGKAEGKTGSQAQSGDGIKAPQGPKGLVVVVGTAVSYSTAIEFGVSGTKRQGRPYLYPAYFMHEGEAISRIKKVFNTRTIL